MANGVPISVEPFTETRISEIHPTGGETCVEQESLSEKLTRLAQQIDFGVDVAEIKAKSSGGSGADPRIDERKEKEEEEEVKHPWEDVVAKLRQAFTELSVLCDVLNIVKQNRPQQLGLNYLAFETVIQEQPKSDPRYQLLANRKALLGAAEILLDGANAMMSSLESGHSSMSSGSAFHLELMKMRKRWRLRRIGANITGDVSYQSVGSELSQLGHFDVQKGDETSSGAGTLKVNLPLSLQSRGKIFVFLTQAPTKMMTDVSHWMKICESLWNRSLSDANSSAIPTWQHDLESAQEYLFAKELFLLLCKEASSCRLSACRSETTISGSILIAQIFPGHWLTVVFDSRSLSGAPKEQTTEACPLPLGTKRMADLELCLYQRLTEVHAANSNVGNVPTPTSLSLRHPKKYRQAGFRLVSEEELVETPEESSWLFEVLVRQARHYLMKGCCLRTLDETCREIIDRRVTLNSSPLSTSTQSVIGLKIQSTSKSLGVSVQISVKSTSIRAIGSNGGAREFLFSDLGKKLKAFVFYQIALDNFCVAESEILSVGWRILSKCKQSPIDDHSNTCPSILAANKNGTRAVSLVFLWEPVPAVRASISKSNDRNGKQASNRFDALRSLDFTTVQLSEFAVRGLACQLRALLLAEE